MSDTGESTNIRLVQQLWDREEIRACLYRYCKGVDRSDADLIRSAYWPDIDASQLSFRGDAEGFIAWSFPQVAKMDLITHQVGNILIDLEGDAARVESSFISYRRVDEDGQMRGHVGGGRYLDRFERRNGEWRIAKRLVVPDWNESLSDPEPAPGGAGDAKRWPADISYSWFS